MTSLSEEEENYVRMCLLLTGISPRAARAYFDHKFHPFFLGASLKKGHKTLFDLKKTRVINQHQWNLLYPLSPDVPMSSNFDITLVVTLLRNLTNMTSPHRGFDRLPYAIEITPGSDLARIKYYRNYLAHLDDAKIDNKFYKTAWADIREAIGRLGGMSLMKECDKLKTKMLDRTNAEIIQDIKAPKDEIKELKQSLEYLTTTHQFAEQEIESLRSLLPSYNEEQINKEIEDWEKKDQMFVSTRAYDYVIKCLLENSCVTLTGSAGVGKSFIARHTALVLQKEGYKIIPVDVPTDIRYHYNSRKQIVFLVDDICGNYTANQHEIENWRQLLPFINRIVKDKCCKIIVSCRLQIYKDDTFNLLSPFKSCECNLISDKLCLTVEEKNDLADMYIGTYSKNLTEAAKGWEMFPLLCDLYHKNKDVDVNDFFSNPFYRYKKELDALAIYGAEGKYKFCCFALCVLFDNKLQETWLQGKITDEQRQILEDTCEACKLNRSTSKEELRAALHTLEGTFICKQYGIYRTIHDKLFDFLAHYFGKRMIECLIDHADVNLIEERFAWWNSSHDNPSNTEFMIEIRKEYLKAYLKRLVKDWSIGMVIFVFRKKDMKVSSFRQHLVHHLLRLKKSKQITLTNTKDVFAENVLSSNTCNLQIILSKVGEYPLIIACKLGYTDMVEWILQTNVDVNQCRNDGTTGLSMACQRGHISILKMLLEKNANVDLCNSVDQSPLFFASQEGRSDILKLLLERNPNVDSCDKHGVTPLIKACLNNDISTVHILLQHRPYINAQSNNGANALYFSVLKGNLSIAQLLLENNADCNICIYSKDRLRDLFPYQALNAILIEEKYKTYRTLIYNAPLNVQDYIKNKPGHNDSEGSTGYNTMVRYAFGVVAGSSPLQIACFMGRVDIFRCLLDHNADINMAKEDGKTPLSYACEVGHEDIVKILLEKNINIDPCDNDGFTPLIKACLDNRTSLVQLLIKHKSDINARTFHGANALYFSALNGNLEITQLLLENNADCNICIYSKDRWGEIFTDRDKYSSKTEQKDNTYHTLMNNAPLNVQEYIRKKPGHNDREGSTGYRPMINYAFGVVAGSSPLQIACFMGRVDIVRCLLDYNADINMAKEDGTTPLSYACEVGHEDIVRIILKKNPNIDPCDNDGFTPLIKACLNNRTSLVQLLIENKPDINARTIDGANALYFSALNGNLEITQLLLVNNADCNICIYSKYRWKDIFTYHTNKPLASKIYDALYMLMNNAPPNVQDYIRKKPGHNDSERSSGYEAMIDYAFEVVAGSSPLQIACFMGRVDIVRCLLDHNADINMTKEDGTTPLSYACEVGHEDIVKILLEKNANIDPCDNDGFTPLIKSCLNNHASTVKLLIKHKPYINARTFSGANALYFSILNGNLEITQLLLENNVDCNICIHTKESSTDTSTYDARTSLHRIKLDIFYTLMRTASSNVKRYVRSKSLFYETDELDDFHSAGAAYGDHKSRSIEYVFNVVAGSCPLHLACFMGWPYIFRCLLEHKANINLKKEDGTTPLSYACEVGHIDTVKMLLEKNATVDPCDNVGVTPLIKACLNNNARLVQLLVQHKSAINASTFVGHNALFFSALNGNLEITQFLLENGAYCIFCEERIQYEFDNNARKSLVQNQLDIFYTLMTKGSSNVKQYVWRKTLSVDYDYIMSKEYVFSVVAGSSPLHIACFMGWSNIVRCLLEHNANIDMTKKDGTTPLFYACEVGHEDIVRLLLDKGAKTQISRTDGKSPLNIARDNGHKSVVLVVTKHAEDRYSVS